MDCRDSQLADTQAVRHCHYMPCLQCELPEILEATIPRDPELLDLIEQAFIEGQIDSQKAALAYLWLSAKKA